MPSSVMIAACPLRAGSPRRSDQRQAHGASSAKQQFYVSNFPYLQQCIAAIALTGAASKTHGGAI